MTRALATLLVLQAALAHADIMSPTLRHRLDPPRDCPRGAVGVAGAHGSEGNSPYCAPTTCTTDADCTRTTRPCREQALCIEQVETGDRSLSGEPETFSIARSTCGPQNACGLGTCETARRCVGRPRRAQAVHAITPIAATCSMAPGGRGGLVAIAFLALACARRRRAVI